MIAGQFNILVGLLKEIRDRLPRPVAAEADLALLREIRDRLPSGHPARDGLPRPSSTWTASDEAATEKFPAYLPDLVPYTIDHPINGTQVETRRAYVDINGHIRFLPAGFPPGSSWRALWIERETR